MFVVIGCGDCNGDANGEGGAEENFGAVDY